MTKIFPSTIRSMTMDEAERYGYVSNGHMFEYGCTSYRLSAGKIDRLHIFKSGVVLYVLTLNVKQTYLGLDVYMSKTEDAIDSIFLQGDYAISECIGHDWRSLSLVQLVTRLVQLFM